MLSTFHADLHMHTCLSPCSEIDMTPREIVAVSLQRGLQIIAITDHNSSENTAATQRAAAGTGLTVLAGMEISTSEEVHILALFEDTDHARRMQDVIYENLPPEENDERLYGHQIIVNEHNEVMGFNKRLLIAATTMNAHTLVGLLQSFGGLAIASHVDREAFSLISQLGFIPADLHLDALEFSPRTNREKAASLFLGLKGLPWVSFSDAHHVTDIGRRFTTFTLKEPTLNEIRLALKNEEGRSLSW